jgi:rhamnose utilization protein RhaD (predicted bifunctional aldolase and dehydrogenase)
MQVREAMPELDGFCQLAERIGQDILKTQGAGGNVSIKRNGLMWIKASGTWLAHALEHDILVPVLVDPLVAALRNGDARAEKATDFVLADLNTSQLRPSIETSVHAVLPQSMVAHFHCVNTIALAVLADREEVLAERMAQLPDLKWAAIPYCRPGTPLAAEIDKVAQDRPDVLVLFNHGLVVCAESVAELADRIERVCAVFSQPVTDMVPPDMSALAAIAANTNYHPADDLSSHAPALTSAALSAALGGSLYPDHVIFLGTELGLCTDSQTLGAMLDAAAARGLAPPKMVLVEGKGVLLSNDLTPGGKIMARCLAEVVARIPSGAALHYLDAAQEYELTHWEAEQYRQSLDRQSVARS